MDIISPKIDRVGIEERVERLKGRSIKGQAKKQALRMALNMIDLTTLEGKDTPGKVRQMCHKALHLHDLHPGLPPVAAVCVYPSMVSIAKECLRGTPVKVASVATAFPHGLLPLHFKVRQVRYALEEGADEIDMVMSRSLFLQGDYRQVFDEIAAIKEACGKKTLKVILETGELDTLDQVRRASDLAISAGADFIKTSTGKIQPAATLPVVLVMLHAIRDHYLRTGKKVGMKPAGGISNAKTALQHLVLVHETLGDEWLDNAYFRFGASSLANDLLMQIMKQETGVYQTIDYFSKD